MKLIFHICSRKEANEAQEKGVYVPARYSDDGFIHCAYLDQVCDIANHLYKNVSDLVLLEINPQALGDKVVSEDLYELNEEFPHIYCELPWDVVRAVYDFPHDQSGNFALPKELKSN